MTKVIGSWNDLEDYGIICLTGESDALSFRLLCDLTPSGEVIINQLLGSNVQFTQGTNWNSSKGQKSSVLLAYDMLKAIATICLFNVDGYTTMGWLKNGSVIGVDEVQLTAQLREVWGDDAKHWMEHIQRYHGEVDRWIVSPVSSPNARVRSDRYVHAFSGRSR